MKNFALLVLFGCACTVPSLTDLERERARACDDAHPCAEGYLCVAALCRVTGVGNCTEAQTRACGSAVGECAEGAQTCGSNNQWGDCIGGVGPAPEVCDGKDNNCDTRIDEGVVGASCGTLQGVCASARKRCVGGALEATCTAGTFGADYEAVESRCDNKDNDCDGMTDESISRPCERDAGVCAGLQVACVAGAFSSCDSLYRSRPGYQEFEQLCDGLDNDCDGKADRWSPQNVSASPGASSRRASAAQLITGDVLVLWEEGMKVVARAASLDGTFSQVVTPSESVNGATRAFAPVVASNANVVYAAWAEETPNGLRVMLAPLDNTGKSTITAGVPPTPSAMAINQTGGTTLGALALAVDSAANRVFLAAVVDGRLNSYAFPLALPANAVWSKVNQLTGTIGKVAIATAGGGNMWLAAEQRTAGTIRRCAVTATGSLLCVTPDQTGTAPQLTPQPSMTVALTFANAANALRETCTLRGVDAGCSNLGTLFSSRAAISNLSVGFNAGGEPHALAWVEGGLVNAGVLFPDGGVVSTSLSGVDSQPSALSVSPSLSLIVVDLDNANGNLSNEIVLQRQCGP